MDYVLPGEPVRNHETVNVERIENVLKELKEGELTLNSPQIIFKVSLI